jgi:hypothetical protein
MPFRAVGVNLSGFRNKTLSGSRGRTHECAWLSRVASNRAANADRREGVRFVRKMMRLRQSRSRSDRPLNASDCGKGSFFFLSSFFNLHIWRRQNPTCSSLHATFVPWVGIFRRHGLHLTNLGAEAGASFARPFGFAQNRTAEGGCPYGWVAVPKVAVHICGFSMIPGQGAGLTCLSVRCLSSYLIFSASSSDKQAAVRFAGARLDGLVRRP